MEKKERYYSVIDFNEDFVIRDCESGRTCKSLFEVKTLLNYQDREINRLTKMLYTTTKHADKLNEENNKLNKIIKANIISTDKVIKENQQLKQQLHELPKKIVEEIKDKIPEIGGMKCEIIIDDSLTLNTLLDTILKKYGGEDE